MKYIFLLNYFNNFITKKPQNSLEWNYFDIYSVFYPR